MEVEIDPLACLEQFMQVTEGEAVPPNVDEQEMMDINENGDLAYYPDNDYSRTPAPVSEASLMIPDPLAEADDPLRVDQILDLPHAPSFDFAEQLALLSAPLDAPTTTSCQAENNAKKAVPTVPHEVPQVNNVAKVTSVVTPSRATLAEINFKKLATVTHHEMNQRKNMFKDFTTVIAAKLDCTVCGDHIGCMASLDVSRVTHPLLRVLMCPCCRGNYVITKWNPDLNEIDQRCRWCGKPNLSRNPFKYCSNCPFAFCQQCISRNFLAHEWKKLEKTKTWACYVCRMFPLYFMRGVCATLSAYVNVLKIKTSRQPVKTNDLSICCKKSKVNGVVRNTKVVQENVPANQQNLLHNLLSHSTTERDPRTLKIEWVKARIARAFKDVEKTRDQVVITSKQMVAGHEWVKKVDMMLASVMDELASCRYDLGNWLSDTAKLTAQVNSSQPSPQVKSILVKRRNTPVKPTTKSTATKQSKTTPKNISVKPGSSRSTPCKPSTSKTDYSHLFRLYNIKPCRVVLKQLDMANLENPTSNDNWTTDNPAIISLLTPMVEMFVSDDIIDSQGQHCIVIDDD